MQLEKVNIMYTEPSLYSLLSGATVVGNYGTQTEQGHCELQVYKHATYNELYLVVQSKTYRGLLGILPTAKLKWHTVAAQERFRLRQEESKRVADKAKFYHSSNDGLYAECYSVTMQSRHCYYARLVERLNASLQDYAVNGKPMLAQMELAFSTVEVGTHKITPAFAVFVISKICEHYAPQHFDKLPSFRREFTRNLKYRLGSNIALAGETLDRAILVGSLMAHGFKASGRKGGEL